jgi:hypothetical protein
MSSVLRLALSGCLLAAGMCGCAAQAQSPSSPVRSGELVPTQSWFWNFLPGGSLSPDDVDPSARPRPESSGTYRTLCVRMCDGFFAPVSSSTTRSKFTVDAKRCEQSCPGRSRLFIQRTGSEPDTMVDLEGRPYTKLENAFRHQREYVPDCTCRGNPWDKEAQARHRAYAEAKQGQGSQASAKTEKATAPRPRDTGKQEAALGGQRN